MRARAAADARRMVSLGPRRRAWRRPVLIYDAECAFCRGWIQRWRATTGGRVRYLPYQRPGVRWRYRVTKREARRAAQLIESDGRRYRGATALLRALLRSRSPWWRFLARAALTPGVRSAAEAVYRRIAGNRRGASRVQRRLEKFLGAGVPRHRIWSFLSQPELALRGLGIIYLVAFTSLRRQALGLYGERGILPVRQYLERVRAVVGENGKTSWPRLLRAVPSLLWFGASDADLLRLCRLGQLAGAALASGASRRVAAAVAWGTYLSLVAVGQDFLRFQWDALLLEAGLQGMLGRPRRSLMRLLAFRLQFESGLAKLASRDPAWRGLSACSYHQETQPLPTPVGWYVHHLPRRIQQAGTALTLLVEGGVVFLVVGPRRLRRLAVVALMGFQGLIALTGNYGFFNWLTVVLNLSLLERPADAGSWSRSGTPSRLTELVDGAAGGMLLALNGVELVRRVAGRVRLPPVVSRLWAELVPFHVVGSYGLFSVMTTRRPEIVVEGSNDGREWREYQFRYKPGDVMRAPAWIAPHQPRLDWQMWFAALGYPPRWFLRFLVRLLEGSSEVLALLETNPFPERPPTYVQAVLYDYRIADLETRRRTGAWWLRSRIGIYVPPCALENSA